MDYWSNMEIPAIQTTIGLDTQLRLLSKQILNVTGYTVSTTGYALYAFILNNEPELDIDRIQKFLQEQRMYIGGWTSSWVSAVTHSLKRVIVKLSGTFINLI